MMRALGNQSGMMKEGFTQLSRDIQQVKLGPATRDSLFVWSDDIAVLTRS